MTIYLNAGTPTGFATSSADFKTRRSFQSSSCPAMYIPINNTCNTIFGSGRTTGHPDVPGGCMTVPRFVRETVFYILVEKDSISRRLGLTVNTEATTVSDRLHSVNRSEHLG